jgi:hypothetical protein
MPRPPLTPYPSKPIRHAHAQTRPPNRQHPLASLLVRKGPNSPKVTGKVCKLASFGARHVGDVRAPDLVRPRDRHVPQQVRVDLVVAPTARRSGASAAGPPPGRRPARRSNCSAAAPATASATSATATSSPCGPRPRAASPCPTTSSAWTSSPGSAPCATSNTRACPRSTRS